MIFSFFYIFFIFWTILDHFGGSSKGGGGGLRGECVGWPWEGVRWAGEGEGFSKTYHT